MLNRDFAEHFAAEWIDAWNSHELNRILSHYADDFEMSSPIIVQLVGEPSGTLQGKKKVGAHWAMGQRHSKEIRICTLNW